MFHVSEKITEKIYYREMLEGFYEIIKNKGIKNFSISNIEIDDNWITLWAHKIEDSKQNIRIPVTFDKKYLETDTKDYIDFMVEYDKPSNDNFTLTLIS